MSASNPQKPHLETQCLRAKLQDQSDSLYVLSFELTNLKQGLERGEYTDHNKKYLNVRFKFPQQIAERTSPLTIGVVDVGGQNLVSEDHVYASPDKLLRAAFIIMECITWQLTALLFMTTHVLQEPQQNITKLCF